MKSTLQNSRSRFYAAMAVASFLIVSIGFGNFYGRRLLQSENVPLVLHIHGAVFMCWILSFMAQCFFIIKGHLDLHLKYGRVAMLLVPAMLVSGLMTTMHAGENQIPGIPGLIFSRWEGFFILNINALFVFTGLACAGWYFKSKPEIHKRLMLMATVIGLTPPGISRLPYLSGNANAIAAGVMIFLIFPFFYEWVRYKKIHRADVLSLPFAILILPPVVTLISEVSWVQKFIQNLFE